MSGLVLGCDGGNTKTVAVVAGPDGRIAGWGRAGSSDVHDVAGEQAALRELHAAVDAACAMAGGTAADVEAAVFGLAGADWPEDFQLLRDELGARLGCAPVVLNDAVNAVRCGTDDGVGVVVSCGTGGTAAAVGPDGRVYHRGFWPAPSGAREIGRLGLQAVQNAHLGLGPATSLTTAALARYGGGDADELLHLRTRRGRGPETDARWFCPDVLDAAAAGDAVAVAIVAGEGRVLGGQARVSAQAVGFTGTFPVVLVGGVFKHPGPLLRQAVLAELPGAEPVAARWEPAIAALLRALGGAADAEAAVSASLPDAAVFATD